MPNHPTLTYLVCKFFFSITLFRLQHFYAAAWILGTQAIHNVGQYAEGFITPTPETGKKRIYIDIYVYDLPFFLCIYVHVEMSACQVMCHLINR